MQKYLVRSILLALVLLFQIGKTNADGGYTITVFAEFTLKNNHKFKAYFDVYSSYFLGNIEAPDLKKIKLTDADCMKAFGYSYSNFEYLLQDAPGIDEFNMKMVYLSLEERNLKPFRSTDKDIYDIGWQVGLVFPEDILHIRRKDVQKVRHISCKKSQHNSGIYPTTIGLLDSITNMRYWNTVTFAIELGYIEEMTEIGVGDYHVLFNFNEKYNEAELRRLIKLKYDPINNQEIKEIREKYRRKGILILPYEEEEKISKLYRKQISQANVWMWAHGILVTVHTIGC